MRYCCASTARGIFTVFSLAFLVLFRSLDIFLMSNSNSERLLSAFRHCNQKIKAMIFSLLHREGWKDTHFLYNYSVMGLFIGFKVWINSLFSYLNMQYPHSSLSFFLINNALADCSFENVCLIRALVGMVNCVVLRVCVDLLSVHHF